MWDKIAEFFTAVPFWELILILFAKTIEVTLGTLRVILIAKGYRKQGTILSFIEIMLWVFIASKVLIGMAEAPMKGVVYGLGFSIGVFLGSKIEAWLAFGKIIMQIIVDKNDTIKLENVLRDAGYAVTVLDAHGRDNDKVVLIIVANRKGKEQIFDVVMEVDPKAVIVSNDVSYLRGGYLKTGRKIAK